MMSVTLVLKIWQQSIIGSGMYRLQIKLFGDVQRQVQLASD